MNRPKINLDIIDENSASQAVEFISKLAAENGIDWALVGGLAMNLYGSDRLTKDIDIIADKLLPMSEKQIVGRLKQGGERYNTETDEKVVTVDWIIRNDEFKPLFQQTIGIALDALSAGEIESSQKSERGFVRAIDSTFIK